MIFSKLGHSLSRSARSRFQSGAILGGYGARSSEVVGHSTRLGSGSGDLGFLKGYLTSIGVNKGFGARSPIENWKLLLANAGFRRLFSSESPNRKNYENPKDKKEIPKGNENHKSESKEDSSVNGSGLLFTGLALSLSSFASDQKEISFQEFKNKLLEPGLVDHIVVSNKSVAKVYVRSSPNSNNQSQDNDIAETATNVPARQTTSQYQYYFNIGSVESFEEKLEEAQEALGIDPHDYVPVTYVNDIIW